MIIKLNDSLEKRMVEQPESGMGYQRVNVKLKDGRIVPGFVYNSEILEVSESIKLEEISDIEVVG